MITQEKLKSILFYDPDSGIFTWKHRGPELMPLEKTRKSWNTKYSGKKAGCVFVKQGANGYRHVSISINPKRYLAHRLAFLYMTGKWPKDEVDHINNDSTDNRWCNLRESDGFKNHQNLSKFRNNTSGVTGVYLCKKSNKWKAEVMVNRVKHRLGSFAYDDLDLAAMEVMEFRAENGFDPTHGMEFAPYHKGARICTPMN